MSRRPRWRPAAAAIALAGAIALSPPARAADEAPLRTLTLPDVPISAEFSPDGRTILAASPAGAHLFEAETGRLTAVVKEATAVAVLSPDGREIAAASPDRSVRLIEVAGRRQRTVLAGHAGEVLAIRFSRDGGRLVTASRDRTARVWDTASGRQLLVLAHGGEVRAAGFNPEGNRVVTVASDRNVRLWTTDRGAAVMTLTYPEELLFAAYSPDGTRIAVSTGGLEVRLWNAELRGMPHLTMRGHSAPAAFAGFSPDGARLVTAAGDGSARVWDAGTGRILAVLGGHDAAVVSAAYSADGKRIVTAAGDKTVRIWATQRLPAAAAAGPGAVAGTIVGLWAAHVPADAEPDLLQAACRTQPGMIHADGLIVVFGDPDAEHLPVPAQHMRCRPTLECDIYEGAPQPGLRPLGAGRLTVADRTARFCFQDRCVDLARCPALEWTPEERTGGFARAWEERVKMRGE